MEHKGVPPPYSPLEGAPTYSMPQPQQQQPPVIINQPPPSTTVTHVNITGSGGCPACHCTRSFKTGFTCCGYLWCILCFPCGILCCLMCNRRKYCPNCSYSIA